MTTTNEDAWLSAPIPMALFCPACGTQHIDVPEPESGWENPPHKSHLCHACQTIWRPADVATAGVPYTKTIGEHDNWPRIKRAAPSKVQVEAVRATTEQSPSLEWHWSTSNEGPMVACGTEDVDEALRHALYESGIATYGEDQTNIFVCRFRPAKINWKRHVERLLESIDEECYDIDGRDMIFTDGTDSVALEKALAEIIKVDALIAYDECEFAPGDKKYETALLRVRNDAAAASGGEKGENA